MASSTSARKRSFSDCFEDESPRKYFKPNKKGEVIHRQARQIILNVYAKVKDENPNYTVAACAERAANLAGVSVHLVKNIRKEFNEEPSDQETGPQLKSPGRKRPNRMKRFNDFDSFSREIIRRKVHQFFANNEVPTVNMVSKSSS